MCNVVCLNTKCDKRLPTGCCGRSYPCSEYIAPYDVRLAESIANTDNKLPLKELANRFEAGNITYGEVPTYTPDDAMLNPYPYPDSELATLEALMALQRFDHSEVN